MFVVNEICGSELVCVRALFTLSVQFWHGFVLVMLEFVSKVPAADLLNPSSVLVFSVFWLASLL